MDGAHGPILLKLVIDLDLHPVTCLRKIGALQIRPAESFRLPFSRLSMTIHSEVRLRGAFFAPPPPTPANGRCPNTPASAGLRAHLKAFHLSM